MELRGFVTLVADFPDDAEWDNKGQLLVAGGRGITEYLSDQMEAAGLKCSKPKRHSFYGWVLEVKASGAKVSCLLQCPGPWLLLSECKASFFGKLRTATNRRAHQEVLQCLHKVLRQDSRFSAIKWFTRLEYESGDDSLGTEAP